jgi:hypothetical protein
VVEGSILVPVLESLCEFLEILPDLPHVGILRVEERLELEKRREGVVAQGANGRGALYADKDVEQILDAGWRS